jgi:TonB family protein
VPDAVQTPSPPAAPIQAPPAAVVVRSSGHDDLDQEALAWIQRAQPLPRPPPEVATDPIELVVPLRFELR